MILGIRRSSVLPCISSIPKGKGHPGAHQVTTGRKATEQRKVTVKSKITTTKNMNKTKQNHTVNNDKVLFPRNILFGLLRPVGGSMCMSPKYIYIFLNLYEERVDLRRSFLPSAVW